MKISSPILLICILLLNACKTSSENNINADSSLKKLDELTENPLLENVLTTVTHPTDSTMQTLYGNGIAWDFANTHSDLQCPVGSKLYLVTWKQKPDSLWFGANIPKEIVFIEEVKFIEGNSPSYTFYQGKPLKKASSNNSSGRLSYILSLKMAITP